MNVSAVQPLRPGYILFQVNGLIFLSVALTLINFGQVFALVPLVVLFNRRFGIKWVAPSLAVWLVGLFFLDKTHFVAFLLSNLVPSLIIYYFYFIKSNWSGLIISLTVYVALQVCFMAIYPNIYRKEILDPALKFYAQFPLDDLRKDLVVNLITHYLASLFYISFMLLSFFTVISSGFFVSRPGRQARLMRELETLKLNFNFIWLLIAVWMGVAISFFLKNDFFRVFMINAAVAVTFFYFMQGFVVCWVLFSNPKVTFLMKIIILGLIMLLLVKIPVLFAFILCSIGVFDEWIGFRSIKFEQPDGGNEE